MESSAPSRDLEKQPLLSGPARSPSPRASTSSLPARPEKTPLPWRQLAVIGAIIFSEPLSLTILFPFVQFMVEDFLQAGTATGDRGLLVGIIESSFAVAQLASALLWARLSDKVGRKPVLLFGLVGSAISSIWFGMSLSYASALAARTICGLLNGNVGVAKAVLASVTDHTNRAGAFATLGFLYAVGSIVGPFLGGVLAQPAKTYPGAFGDIEFFKTYQYFLPCLASALVSVLGFVAGFILLENDKPWPCSSWNKLSEDKAHPDWAERAHEQRKFSHRSTHSRLRSSVVSYASRKNAAAVGTSSSNSLANHTPEIRFVPDADINSGQHATSYQSISGHPDARYDADDIHSCQCTSEQLEEEEQQEVDHLLASASLDLPNFPGAVTVGLEDEIMSVHSVPRLSTRDADCLSEDRLQAPRSYHHGGSPASRSRESIGRYRPASSAHQPNPKHEPISEPSTWQIIKKAMHKDALLSCIGYAVLCLALVAYNVIYPLWAALTIEEGGLNLGPQPISYTTMAGGGALILTQLFLLQPAVRFFGATRTFCYGSLVMAVGIVLLPGSATLLSPEGEMTAGSWILLTSSAAVFIVGAGLAFTSSTIMISNSATNETNATANGVGQALGSLARAIGPVSAAGLLSWSVAVSGDQTRPGFFGFGWPINYHFAFDFSAVMLVAISVVGIIFISRAVDVPAAEGTDDAEPQMMH